MLLLSDGGIICPNVLICYSIPFHVFAICRRLEIDNDVTCGVAVDNVGVDVPIKFGDSGSNRFRDILEELIS